MAAGKLIGLDEAAALVPDGARLGIGGVLLRRKPIALLEANLSETPPKLRAIAPGHSELLERVVAATLGKDPAERPASARELRAVLRDVPEATGA